MMKITAISKGFLMDVSTIDMALKNYELKIKN